jgi:hypothetical protein
VPAGLETFILFHFPTVQKMTLDSAVSSGGQPAEKPKGLKNTPPLPQFAAPAFATFLACLLPKFHPRLLPNGVSMRVSLVSTWPLSESQRRA